jgi:16S rRNA processing protein RimM
VQNLIYIGTIVRPHGLGGDLHVELQQSLTLPPGATVRIGFSSAFSREYMLESFIPNGLYAIVHLRGINSRDAAEHFREHGIFAPAAVVKTLGFGSLQDIQGWSVLDVHGNLIGTLIEVEENPAHPLLRIELNSGGMFLLPYVEEFIIARNDDKRTLTIAPPEGLLEVYSASRTISPSKRKH